MIELSIYQLVAQGLGLVAPVVAWTGMASPDDRFLKKTAMVSTLIFALHYYMIGIPVASMVCLVIAVRNFASLFKMARRLAPLFICMHLSVGFLLAEDIFTWLPSIAAVGGAIAYFYMSAIPMRVVLIGCTMLWLIHDVHVQSVGGVISCVVGMVITVTTIYRISRRDDLVERVVPVPETVVLPVSEDQG